MAGRRSGRSGSLGGRPVAPDDEVQLDFCKRPLLERVHVLCVVALALDSIFLLVYGLSVLVDTRSSIKMHCYEARGYGWHHIIEIGTVVSCALAAVGLVIHGNVCCAPAITMLSLSRVSSYATSLVVWVFIEAVIEFMAFRSEPEECKFLGSMYDDSAHPTGTQDGRMQDDSLSESAWELIYMLLWFSWVTSSLMASVLARRGIPIIDAELRRREEAQRNPEPTRSPEPNLVGVPMNASEIPAGLVAGATFAVGRPVSGPVDSDVERPPGYPPSPRKDTAAGGSASSVPAPAPQAGGARGNEDAAAGASASWAPARDAQQDARDDVAPVPDDAPPR